MSAERMTVEQAQLAGILSPPRGRPKRKKGNSDAEDAFAFGCRILRLPKVERQRVFPQTRDPKNKRKQWRTDFYFSEYLIAVEIDGGIWMPGGGAHSHPVDITRNMAKRNDLAIYQISVLAFTPDEVKSGHALAFTQRMLTLKGWKGPLA